MPKFLFSKSSCCSWGASDVSNRSTLCRITHSVCRGKDKCGLGRVCVWVFRNYGQFHKEINDMSSLQYGGAKSGGV